MERARRLHRRRGGFTLIELLVAIAILGILGTVVIAALWDNVDDARQTGTKTKLDTVKSTVQQYKRLHNELPRELSVLTEDDPRHGNRPWLTEDDIRDTWGNFMVIKMLDRPGQFEIVSFGGDGVDNGFDLSLGFDRDLSSDRPLNPPTENP